MKKILLLSVMLITVLSACGGSVSHSDRSEKLAAGPAIPPVATTEFLSLASGASCANLRNRMFVIDQKHVFWDKAGSCSDASFELVLFGNDTKTSLCSSKDTIAGPKTSCSDEQFRSLFVSITNNLDKADLGLGSAHQVQQLDVPAGANFTMSFEPVYGALFYGVAPASVVIKDAAAWKKFLENAQIKPDFRPAIEIDFSKKMVVGVFFKSANNCSVTKILKLSSNGQKLLVEYADQERISIQSCDANSTLASTPMNLVMLDKLDLPVDFVNVNASQIPFSFVDVQAKSPDVGQPFQTVVKDAASWATYVADNLTGAVPAIDFTKNMLVAINVPLGGCKTFDGVNLWRSGGKFNVVTRILDNADPQVFCTADFKQFTKWIQLERSDDTVEFSLVRGWYVFGPD